MKLSEEEKEDITDMVIESRDVEEDLTTAYLKGYADAEEKYRKKIKELETKQKEMCEEYCPKTERIKELEEENKIYVQKVKDILQKNRNELFSVTYLDNEQYKTYTMQIDRINKIEKELLEDK